MPALGLGIGVAFLRRVIGGIASVYLGPERGFALDFAENSYAYNDPGSFEVDFIANTYRVRS